MAIARLEKRLKVDRGGCKRFDSVGVYSGTSPEDIVLRFNSWSISARINWQYAVLRISCAAGFALNAACFPAECLFSSGRILILLVLLQSLAFRYS
jgi:hypothetical protein